MPETWLTYRQLAAHWKTTPEAARARSRRGNYQRRTNNIGAVEILVDLDAPVPEARQKAQDGQTRTATPSNTPDMETPPAATAEALAAIEAHVVTLKDQLAQAEARADKYEHQIDAERERVADLTAQLLRLTSELLDAKKAAEPPALRRSWWQRLVG
jgi:chromosome segregation ATPase